MYGVSRISGIVCRILLNVWNTLRVWKNQLKWQPGRLSHPHWHHIFLATAKTVRRSFVLMPNCITVFLRTTEFSLPVKCQVPSTFHVGYCLNGKHPHCWILPPDHNWFLVDSSSYSILNPSCLIALSTSSWQGNIKSKMSHFSELTQCIHHN